jgi:hypothetical protein
MWLTLVIIAIVNAAIREKLLEPLISARNALPVSGLLLSISIVLVAYISIPVLASRKIEYIFLLESYGLP